MKSLQTVICLNTHPKYYFFYFCYLVKDIIVKLSCIHTNHLTIKYENPYVAQQNKMQIIERGKKFVKPPKKKKEEDILHTVLYWQTKYIYNTHTHLYTSKLNLHHRQYYKVRGTTTLCVVVLCTYLYIFFQGSSTE